MSPSRRMKRYDKRQLTFMKLVMPTISTLAHFLVKCICFCFGYHNIPSSRSAQFFFRNCLFPKIKYGQCIPPISLIYSIVVVAHWKFWLFVACDILRLWAIISSNHIPTRSVGNFYDLWGFKFETRENFLTFDIQVLLDLDQAINVFCCIASNAFPALFWINKS